MPPLRFESVRELVYSVRPTFPVFCVRPLVVRDAARRFAELFPGRVLYALRCNAHPLVLRALAQAGVCHYDTASLAEIALVHRMRRDALSYFMHPVKDRDAIRVAHAAYGVRHFAIDCEEELEKVLDATGDASVMVFVRVAIPDLRSSLSPFGASREKAAHLARSVAARGGRLGLAFELGAGGLELGAYRVALDELGHVIDQAGVQPACIDVGGGFPSPLAGQHGVRLEDCVEQIRQGVRRLGLRMPPFLFAEPGHALIGDGCSLISQVRLRRDGELHLNTLPDWLTLPKTGREAVGPAFATRFFPARPRTAVPDRVLRVFGPSRDSFCETGPDVEVPEDTREGDWIEIAGASRARVDRPGSTAFPDALPEAAAEVFDGSPPRAPNSRLP